MSGPTVVEFVRPKRSRRQKARELAGTKRELERVRGRLGFIEEFLADGMAEQWAKLDGAQTIYLAWANAKTRLQDGVEPHVVKFESLGATERLIWEYAATKLYERLARHIKRHAPHA